METLYVVEPGAYLKKNGNSLSIVKKGKIIENVPAAGLKKLLLCGYVSLTGSVMNFLIKNRVETVFLTPTGRYRARLMLDEHKHVSLRRSQYIRLNTDQFSVKTMKIIVRGKINNMTAFLLRRARDYGNTLLRSAAAGLKRLVRNLDDELSPNAIRGIEGAGTRIYFNMFRILLRNEKFEFRGRNRRPPLDPVNALLSFVYTLLTNEVLSAITICGMDPYMGSLHEISYGRPSLACDLVEEYRTPLGDRFVLTLLNRHMVKPEDFIYRSGKKKNFANEKEMRENRPVEMKPYLFKAFISSYEAMMTGRNSYRSVIRKQVRSFAEYLINPENNFYTPFGI